MRPPNFVGARDQVTDASLLGPFDGQVVDVATNEPIADATVISVWSFDRGDGFIGPHGAETYTAETDAAGRYRIPPPRLNIRGSVVRLVDVHLLVYKRGYVGYRSDGVLKGGRRSDFTVRHNRVELRKWQDSDSHADHLLYLAAPRPLQKAVRWEADLANLDLYRTLGGAGTTGPVAVTPEKPAGPVVTMLLDASGLLTPDEVRQRTGYSDAFNLEDLTDLKRTDFYHGVHFQAAGREERFDLALRVWRAPPGGMDPVVATIQETFGAAKPTGEITPETWTLSTDGVHAVAFIDREEKVGVLLTCGDLQCADIDTAIILAKFAARNLSRLGSIEASAAQPTPATPSVPSGALPEGGLPVPGGSAPGGRATGVASPKGQAATPTPPLGGAKKGGRP